MAIITEVLKRTSHMEEYVKERNNEIILDSRCAPIEIHADMKVSTQTT